VNPPRSSSPPAEAGTAKGIDLTESAAGEEDPGASIDLAMDPVRSGPGAGKTGHASVATPSPMSPGDEAPQGTPGTGENVCPACGGSGRQGAAACPNCQGTGTVTVGVGGA